jgi:hypothetical protein
MKMPFVVVVVLRVYKRHPAIGKNPPKKTPQDGIAVHLSALLGHFDDAQPMEAAHGAARALVLSVSY